MRRCGLEAGVARSRYTSTCFGAKGWATDSEPGEVSCSPTPARGADGRGPAVRLAWRDGRSAQLHCGAGMEPASHGLVTRVRASGAEGWATDSSPERRVVARRPRGPTAGASARAALAGGTARSLPPVRLPSYRDTATGGMTREGRTVHGICTPHPQGHVPSGEAGVVW